jgi:hypothetical protein
MWTPTAEDTQEEPQIPILVKVLKWPRDISLIGIIVVLCKLSLLC